MWLAAAVLPWAEETESRPADQRGREALERRIGANMVLGDREIAAPWLGAHLLDARPPAEEKLDKFPAVPRPKASALPLGMLP